MPILAYWLFGLLAYLGLLAYWPIFAYWCILAYWPILDFFLALKRKIARYLRAEIRSRPVFPGINLSSQSQRIKYFVVIACVAVS